MHSNTICNIGLTHIVSPLVIQILKELAIFYVMVIFTMYVASYSALNTFALTYSKL